jgi:hypothetical protein
MLPNKQQTNAEIDLSLEKFSQQSRKENAPISFSSRSELACGVLLNRYLGLKLIEGVTVHRMMSRGATADFFLPEQNILLEFHPIMLRHEFIEKGTISALQKVLRRVKQEHAQAINTILKREFMKQYARRRCQRARNSTDPEVKSARVLVVGSAEAIYKSVIVPFGTDIPSRKEFIRQFDKLVTKKHGYHLVEKS